MRTYSNMKPATQRTIYSRDKTISLFLTDDMQLLVKPKSAPYPYPLDAVTVHSLLNTLWIYRHEIIAESSKHNGVHKPGYTRDRDILDSEIERLKQK